MNIFVTNASPILSAYALDDKRINKMVVESAQMLSTALRMHGCNSKLLYKVSYAKHPCTLWVMQNRSNFRWLVSHALTMCLIYSGLRNRKHACEKVILFCSDLSNKLPKGKRTPFVDCTEFKNNGKSVMRNYRKFMNLKWNKRDKRKPTWTNRNLPAWRR